LGRNLTERCEVKSINIAQVFVLIFCLSSLTFVSASDVRSQFEDVNLLRNKLSCFHLMYCGLTKEEADDAVSDKTLTTYDNNKRDFFDYDYFFAQALTGLESYDNCNIAGYLRIPNPYYSDNEGCHYPQHCVVVIFANQIYAQGYEQCELEEEANESPALLTQKGSELIANYTGTLKRENLEHGNDKNTSKLKIFVLEASVDESDGSIASLKSSWIPLGSKEV